MLFHCGDEKCVTDIVKKKCCLINNEIANHCIYIYKSSLTSSDSGVDLLCRYSCNVPPLNKRFR